MTETPIRLAVIGLGMASKPHLAALRQLEPKVDVAGVFARNTSRRMEVSEAWGWPAFDSVDAICAASDVDAVLLITPPNARMEIVAKLAAAGKHILMEKPVERTLIAATNLVETCERAGVTLGIVFQHRFRAGAMALTELLQSGRLGPIRVVRANVPWWREQAYYDQPGRGTYGVDGGGVLITQAIHLLDLMLSLTGPVSEVQSMMGRSGIHQMEAEDFATAGLRFANGAMGSIVATTAGFPGGTETLHIDAEHGSAVLTAGALTVHWRDGKTDTVGDVTGSGGGSDPMDFPCDWHRDLIADFAFSLRTTQPPKISGRDALAVHILIDALERSAQQGQRIKIVTKTIT